MNIRISSDVLAIVFSSFCSILQLDNTNADVVQIDAANLVANNVIDFEEFDVDDFSLSSQGTNFDGLVSSKGVLFGERFSAQALFADGTFDTLTHPSVTPLNLLAGAPGNNLAIGLDTVGSNGTKILAGLGPVGFPKLDAVGEGAISFLFPKGQLEIGFDVFGAEGVSGQPMYLQFFDSNGNSTLQDFLTIDAPTDGSYAFRVNGLGGDIRGVSIYNADFGGFAIDNIRFSSIPEPSGIGLLSAIAGVCLAGLRRRA